MVRRKCSGSGNRAALTDAPIRGFETHDPAHRSVLRIRFLAVGARFSRHKPALTAAAEPPLDPPAIRLVSHRFQSGPVKGIDRCSAQRPFVHIRLAQNDGASMLEPLYYSGIFIVHSIRENLGAGGGS